MIEVTSVLSGLRRARLLLSRAWSLLNRGHGGTAGSVHVAPAEPSPLALARVSHLYHRRPVLVAADLNDLRGPAAGTVTLPVELHWSGSEDAAVFNLDDPRQRPAMYAAVLREAGEAADLQAWLNAGLLADLWPRLVLPKAVREAWEEQHPALSEARAARLRPAS